jgi:hypothetical protein
MTRVIVEEFDADIHGYCDDCDFVVSFTEGAGMEDVAERIAETLSICDFMRIENGNFIQFFCCHA